MQVVGIIPARMGSSRYPSKPLTHILGKSTIEHVYKRAALCDVLVEHDGQPELLGHVGYGIRE